MERYDYKLSIIGDIKDWIINETDILENNTSFDDDLISWLQDKLFMEDSVTGNGQNFYDTEENCSRYLSGNYDLLYQAAYEFCISNDIEGIIKHFKNKTLARYFDCTIRCYLLNECIEEALKEL